MALFGRRKRGPAKPEASEGLRHPGPDDDGVTRIIPKEIWDGPQGDFLREIGASPDDPSNLMPTPESIQARHDEMLRQQQAFMDSMNEQMPDSVTLIPWAMIPWSVWTGPHDHFLLVNCDLFPTGPWNMMLLPDDHAGSLVLDLPKHLRGSPPGLKDAANRLIGEAREKFVVAQKRAGAEILDRGLSALKELEPARLEAIGDVQAVAHFLARQTYGDDAYERHRNLFAEALGWGTGL